MGKAKMLGYYKPLSSGSTHHEKAPWQGSNKKRNPKRKSQGGVAHAAKQSKT